MVNVSHWSSFICDFVFLYGTCTSLWKKKERKEDRKEIINFRIKTQKIRKDNEEKVIGWENKEKQEAMNSVLKKSW